MTPGRPRMFEQRSQVGVLLRVDQIEWLAAVAKAIGVSRNVFVSELIDREMAGGVLAKCEHDDPDQSGNCIYCQLPIEKWNY